MNIPNNLAGTIVENMKEIINQDINYIDTNGLIIASTNKDRKGTYHEGAKRVVATKSELVISFDAQYEGTKKGINLPVYFQNDIVGVIGITGSEDEVGKYGKIIKQMTEILIKEAFLAEQEKTSRERLKQFIEELLFLTHREDKKTIKIHSELLNIETEIPRIVIVSRIGVEYENDSVNLPVIYEKLYNFIKRYIDFNPQNLLVQNGMNFIIILDIESIKDLTGLLETIYINAEKKYNVKISSGIGTVSTSVDEIRRSYVEAKKALDVALTSRKKYIVKYSELDIELLLDEVSKKQKKLFASRVFRNIKIQNIDSYLEIITKYAEKNGSITKVAEELFIHKNTLQYKLNKIKKLTGYDPRNVEDMIILYLATLICKSEN